MRQNIFQKVQGTSKGQLSNVSRIGIVSPMAQWRRERGNPEFICLFHTRGYNTFMDNQEAQNHEPENRPKRENRCPETPDFTSEKRAENWKL
jgi:hypothetical protein